MRSGPLHLHVASAGNEFMAHIAELFAAGFRAIDVPAEVIVDGLPLDDAGRGARSLVVAPHEFFPLHFLKTRPTIELEPTLASVAVLNVEQPGSQWFKRAWEFARRARLVIDISPAGQAELERRGVPAVLAPLGYAPMLESAQAGVPASGRPIDLLFFGAGSPRRKAFFARHAYFFSSVGAEIRLSDPRQPARAHTPGYLSGSSRSDLVASAKIVLGVHSSESDYFEQHRALLALANGALLVTERGGPADPLVDGTHFVSGRLEELPGLCRQHLEQPDVLDRIARAGRDLTRTGLPVERGCRAILEAFDPPQAQNVGLPEHARRAALLRQIAEADARIARGERLWASTANAACEVQSETPAVTVLVTLFNYGRFLQRCLESVEAAEPPPGGIELLVVDDASTDASAETAERFMAATAVPTRLIRKQMNTGLASSRNLGFASARGRQVFVLDADNWIFPDCLRALHAALDGSTHAASYGVIARVDDRTGEGTGLLSDRAWDPAALLAGPYIDAMALFDKEAVLSVGGYSTALLEHGTGWEDYDLWLALAARGFTAAHAPRLVAGYREHRQSMLQQTSRRSTALARHLRDKYADLIARYPPQDMYFSYPADGDDAATPEHRQLRAQADQIARLERELATLRGSASWRATAPLRKAIDWMRGS